MHTLRCSNTHTFMSCSVYIHKHTHTQYDVYAYLLRYEGVYIWVLTHEGECVRMSLYVCVVCGFMCCSVIEVLLRVLTDACVCVCVCLLGCHDVSPLTDV